MNLLVVSLLSLLFGIVCSSPLYSQMGLQCDLSTKSARFDCHPDPNPNQGNCQARGCCWGSTTNLVSKTGNPNLRQGIPYCYFPQNYNGYNISSLKQTDYGYRAMLTRSTPSGWPDDIKTLTMDVWLETSKRLHFKIFDGASSRYEVPIKVPKPPGYRSSDVDYDVKFRKMPFGFTVTRKSSGAILFDTTTVAGPLIFADQFIEISSATDTGLIYGLGEHRARLLHNASAMWQQYVMWSRDQPPAGNINLYGVHPFYLTMEKDGQSHGVFLLNSNAMEVELQPFPAITFRTIGGVLDMYVFLGPTPDSVIQQYTAVIGLPVMPPYWALGFQLCKYGYNSAAHLKDVITRNRQLGIPYDVQWSDIDYMKLHLDWTYDSDGGFPGLPDIVNDLHNHSQKYVIIVDPGIGNMFPGKYAPYDEGIKEDVFIRNSSGGVLVGQVWPGTTVFPDFTNPKTADWWYNQAKQFHDVVPFDGLWTDMNEPSNFVTGSTQGCTKGKLDNPPYAAHVGDCLPCKTVCPSARQYISSHYNLHNLYGTTEAIASSSALKRIRGKRSFVVTRSSYPGLGHHAFHWTGDVSSNWDDLSYSVPAILEFQFFGIPFVGADICGFLGDTTEELCIRWMQVGAFYPFMRNHDDIHGREQDPAVWSSNAQQIMKSVTELRYSLLPFMYTQFYYSNINGSPVIQPLFFVYPTDAQTYGIDEQFLWGSSILVSPALHENQYSVKAYFPADQWYDIYDGHLAFDSSGQWQTLKAPLEKINVHVRGGSIIATQRPAVNTVLARKNPFGLIVAFDSKKLAKGCLFWDDGDSIDTVENGKYNMIHFNATMGKITSEVVSTGYAAEMKLDNIQVFGVPNGPSTVTVNGQTAVFQYNTDMKVLSIDQFSADLLKPLVVLCN